MGNVLHGSASTTPRLRAELHDTNTATRYLFTQLQKRWLVRCSAACPLHPSLFAALGERSPSPAGRGRGRGEYGGTMPIHRSCRSVGWSSELVVEAASALPFLVQSR